MIDRQILNEFNKTRLEYKKIELNESREEILQRALPKPVLNKTTDWIIQQLDEILEQTVGENPTFEELLTLIYCAAKTATKLCQLHEKPPEIFPKTGKNQTGLFLTSRKKFLQLLFQERRDSPHPPDSDKRAFWSQIWQERDDGTYENSTILDHEIERIKEKGVAMAGTEFTVKDLKRAFGRMKNWSPGGVDGVQTFWYKKFTTLHPLLVEKINEVVRNPEKMPPFFTRGITRLVPKTKTIESASDFRPMTILPSVYKIISRLISDKLFDYYETNEILAEEQMGDRRGCFGCKKIHTLDALAMSQPEVWGVYVDYKKALDRISHSWLVTTLRAYKVDAVLIEFVENSMKKWQLCLDLDDHRESGDVQVKRGLLQGDPLSTIFYWTAVNPLSSLLRKSGKGLRLRNGGEISHLLYMDDVKIFASNSSDLETMFRIFSDFSREIGMEISVEKSYTFTLVKGRRVAGSPLIYKGQEIKAVDETPTYLGYEQNPTTHHSSSVQNKLASFAEMSWKILKTDLPSEKKNSVIYHVSRTKLAKSFVILKWRKGDVQLLLDSLDKSLKIKNRRLGKQHLINVCLKMTADLWKMRRYFQEEDSSLKRIAVKNDDGITPLNLKIFRNSSNVHESVFKNLSVLFSHEYSVE